MFCYNSSRFPIFIAHDKSGVMNRRSALKQLTVAAGSLITLPAWMVSCGLSDTNEHLSSFNEEEQQLLSAVTDTIIPEGNSTGAISVEADKFLQKLLDDCYENHVRDNVKKQLGSLNQSASLTYKKPFYECPYAQREELMLKLANSANKEEKEFFDLMKSETIRGFNTSQKVMVQYFGYKVAPGYYHGCVPA